MDDYVLIPYGDDASKTAQALLDAADDPAQVRHQPDDGGFRVPEEVAAKAGFGDDEPDDEPDETEEKPKPRRTAKKTTAKKTASKE